MTPQAVRLWLQVVERSLKRFTGLEELRWVADGSALH